MQKASQIPRLHPAPRWTRSVAPLLGLAAAALTQAGCFFTDEGLAPPTGQFYYPTGLAISPGRNVLYVANSDFDLQFNAGTVQVVDLPMVRGIVAQLRDGLNGLSCTADADCMNPTSGKGGTCDT